MNSLVLRVIALICMTIDHIGAVLFPYNLSLRLIGRIAFPIFAFQIVEGYFHTRNVNDYIKRLFIFALISEIPFDLMASGKLIDFSYQNVMFTFVTSLVVIEVVDRILKSDNSMIIKVLESSLVVILGFSLGFMFSLDYYGVGVLLCFLIYLAKKVNTLKLIQNLWIIFAMYLCNFILLGGFLVPVHLFSITLHIPVQGFALISLIPILLYNGKLGPSNKPIRLLSYFYYPVHMFIIFLVKYLIF